MKSKLRHLVAAVAIILSVLVAAAQENRTLTGIVTTFKQYPLFNASVVTTGSGKSVKTDSLGRFAIECPAKENIKVSASGFKSRTVKTAKQNVLQVDLLFEDNAGDFNEAVSNGHISEKTLSYAIDEELKKSGKDYSKYNSIYELISSELYQVTVKGTSVINKAIRSLDSNPQVLYDVDGKILSDISYISPVYVKSIEFIDDVGTTLYGSKGANGVIRIKLKN